MERIICLLIGYVFGLFQTGYLYGKTKHIDIRTKGSGNAGTTNALRTMGKKAGLITLLGDCLKCVFAVQERVRFLRLSQAFSNQQKVQLQNMGRWFRFWNWVQALIHSIQERKIFIFTEQCLDIPKNLLMRSMMRS